MVRAEAVISLPGVPGNDQACLCYARGQHVTAAATVRAVRPGGLGNRRCRYLCQRRQMIVLLWEFIVLRINTGTLPMTDGQSNQHSEGNAARRQVLEGSLVEFHAAAEQAPDIWRDRRRAQEALRAAFELRDLEHELTLRRLHGMRMGQRGEPKTNDGSSASEDAESSPDLPSGEEVRAYHAREEWMHAVEQLRSSSHLGAAKHVARLDRQRTALLRCLLQTLADILPDRARSIENDWARLRAERDRGQSEPWYAVSHLARPGRLEQWEWQMIDRLTIFLEPLLPV